MLRASLRGKVQISRPGCRTRLPRRARVPDTRVPRFPGSCGSTTRVLYCAARHRRGARHHRGAFPSPGRKGRMNAEASKTADSKQRFAPKDTGSLGARIEDDAFPERISPQKLPMNFGASRSTQNDAASPDSAPRT